MQSVDENSATLIGEEKELLLIPGQSEDIEKKESTISDNAEELNDFSSSASQPVIRDLEPTLLTTTFSEGAEAADNDRPVTTIASDANDALNELLVDRGGEHQEISVPAESGAVPANTEEENNYPSVPLNDILLGNENSHDESDLEQTSSTGEPITNEKAEETMITPATQQIDTNYISIIPEAEPAVYARNVEVYDSIQAEDAEMLLQNVVIDADEEKKSSSKPSTSYSSLHNLAPNSLGDDPMDQIIVAEEENGLKVSVGLGASQPTVGNETVTQKTVTAVTEANQNQSTTVEHSLLPRRTGKSGPAEPVKGLVRSFIPISKNRQKLISEAAATELPDLTNERIKSVKFDVAVKSEKIGKPLIDEPSKDIPNLMLTNKGLYLQVKTSDASIKVWRQEDQTIAHGTIFPSLDSKPASRGSLKKFHKDLSSERPPDPFFSSYSQPLPQLRLRSDLVGRDVSFGSNRHKLLNHVKIRRELDAKSSGGSLSILNETQHRLIKTQDFLSIVDSLRKDREHTLPSIVGDGMTINLKEGLAYPLDEFTLDNLPLNPFNTKPRFTATPRPIRTVHGRKSRDGRSNVNDYHSFSRFGMDGNQVEKKTKMGVEIPLTPEEQLLDLISMIAKRANDKLASKSRSRVTEDVSIERVTNIIRENSDLFQSIFEHFSSSSAMHLRLPHLSIYHDQNQSRRAVISDPAWLPLPELEEMGEDDGEYSPPSQQQQRRGRRNATILDPETMNIFWQRFNSSAHQDPFSTSNRHV